MNHNFCFTEENELFANYKCKNCLVRKTIRKKDDMAALFNKISYIQGNTIYLSEPSCEEIMKQNMDKSLK